MKLPLSIFTLLFAGFIAWAAMSEIPAASSDQTEMLAEKAEIHEKSILEEKCFKCHGAEKQKGKVRLDLLFSGKITRDKMELIKESIELIEHGEMPPKKETALSPEEKAGLKAGLSKILKDNLEEGKEENRSVYKRLTNSEYLNTVSELFDFDPKMFNPTVKFPEDQREHGINRIGHELKSSEFLTQEYLEAADEIVNKTVRFDKLPPASTYKFSVKQLSTRLKTDSSAVLYASFHSGDNVQGAEIYLNKFKAADDGFYRIKVLAEPQNQRHSFPSKIIPTDQDEPLRLGIKTGHFSDPNIRAVYDLKDGRHWYECQVWLNKGESPQMVYPNGIYSAHHLRFSLNNVPDIHTLLGLQKKELQGDGKHAYSGSRGYIYHNIFKVVNQLKLPKILVNEVQVEGPFYKNWTPAHNQAVLGQEKLNKDNWKEKLTHFAEKAFRKKVSDDVLSPFFRLISSQIENGASLEEAFKSGLKAVLCSPRFLFQQENEARLSQYETASRLSYFLWSSMPDRELFQAAKENRLQSREQILSQLERMLKDKKVDNFINDFTAAWLQLNELGAILPHNKLFSTFYQLNIQESFKKETQLYFKHILDDNRSVMEFIDSDYSIIDRRLATLYNLPAPDLKAKVLGANEYSGHAPSTAFAKYSLKDQRRGGLMGHASILTVSANGVDTSPVVRGVWILEKLLCSPPPPAPSNVPAIEPDTRGAKSLKERLKKHQNDDKCSSCHSKIDPIGFALENFDPIGQWRSKYRRMKVDAAGVMDGREFKDVTGLKNILLSKKESFTKGFTEKLMSYAAGRKITFLDDAEMQRIHKEFKAAGSGLKDLIRLICTSSIFTQK